MDNYNSTVVPEDAQMCKAGQKNEDNSDQYSEFLGICFVPSFQFSPGFLKSLISANQINQVLFDQ